MSRTAVDSVDINESVERTIDFQRFLFDVVDISESVETTLAGPTHTIVREVEDTVEITDSVERNLALGRSVTDTVGGLPFDPMGFKIPETGGLLCSLLKQNWSINNPSASDIRFYSWYTGSGSVWIYCSDIITVPTPISTGWYLRDYKYFVNVYLFARDIDTMQRVRNHIEDLINANPTALIPYKVDMIKIDNITRNDLYDKNYQNDIFGLIFTVQLKAFRHFHQFV
jgi:hypothetical protein